MSLETMTKLLSTTVGVGGAASVTFSNIPQNYTDLIVKISSRTNNANAAEALTLTINGTNGTSRYLFNSAGTAGSATDTVIFGGNSTGAGATASTFSNSEVYIPNYSGNTYKSISVDYTSENNSTNVTQLLNAGLWSNSSPINSLTFTPYSASTLQQHSTFTLYGIKNARQTAGNSIKATGGNIVFDGTYVYHVFNSTGAFTPTQPILVDALVIAGGGGGGGSGPGGGAGGLLGFANQSLVPTTYACTVGAGGAAGYTNTQQGFRGTTGSDSQFAALTLVKGGGGGGANDNSGQQNGLAGGSGGGGGSFGATIGTGGTATSGQGNNGGIGATDNATYRRVGGGGGAGAAGSNATSTTIGAGGVGSSAYSSWGAATGAGQNVGGVYYFAGGGSGLQSGVGAFGGGGIESVAGTANTGGGGGGSPFSTGASIFGGAGGSGIIIVRYKG